MELLFRKMHKHIFSHCLNHTQSTKTKMYFLKGVTIVKMVNYIG